MKKLIKRLLVLLMFLVLPFTIAGCGDQPVGGNPIEYYLTPLETEYSVIVGETVQIEYDTNIESEILFESYDEDIATVDEIGLVTTIKVGTTSIFVSGENCDFEVNIVVNKKPATIYTITIDGYDKIETTRTGVALKVFLEQEYGTKMARLLHNVQKRGIKTSIDVVSESGNRFTKLVTPALKHTDYCIINELEAQQTTGIPLRDENNHLIEDNFPIVLNQLKKLGVSTWAVIHCPEVGYGIDENNVCHRVPSLKLPAGYIKGTVGAGDAFCAGILYAAEMGMTMQEALKLGACTAAASLSEISASDGVKTVDAVLKLYDEFGV